MACRMKFEDEIDNQNLNNINLHEELIIKKEEVEDNYCKLKNKGRNKTKLEMLDRDINEDDDCQDDVFYRKSKLTKTEQRPRRGGGGGRGSGALSRSRSPLDRPSSPSSPSSPAPVRRPRTRGPRRGGRMRVRGGRAAAAEAVEAAVVAADRGGATGRGRGRGGRGFLHESPGPYNIEDLQVRDAVDMPQGQGLETPLHPRRERRWPPFVVCEKSAPPSPSPLFPPPRAPPRRYRRNLEDAEVMEIFHYGSDPDSDESGNDEEVGAFPNTLSRTMQSMLDTPLDEDFGDGSDDDAHAAEPGAPAAAAGVPPTATDHPRRWYDFEWKEFPNPPIRPESRRETFSQSNVGPTTPRDDPYAIFLDIWDRPIMEYIACETNKDVQRVADEAISGDGNNHLRPTSRLNRWRRDTTADELYTFFGLLLAMGVVVKSRLDEYWSTTSNVLCTPGFSAHMSIDRFKLLARFLHFNDVSGMCGLNLSRSQAKLFKIQPILDHLNKKFQELYTPTQNIAIDESLLMWKGWLDIGQLIPNKKAKTGIKTYELCESQTGYLWRFEVHAHKKSTLPSSQFEDPMGAPTPSIVLRLTQGLEHKGYTLWMDNFYNSPCLARRLKSLGFDCVGTLRTDRKFVPQALHSLTKQNMRQGQLVGLTSGDVDVMVWKDHNRVATISTYHGTAVQTIRGSTKPILIWDYNIMMGGVDKKDQLLAMYPVERNRAMVWYKKMFRRLLNISVLNAFIIHRQSSPSPLSHRNFRISLVTSLLSRHRPPSIPIPIATTRNRRFHASTPRDGEPFEAAIHRIDEFDKGTQTATRRPRRNCFVCKKKVTTFCVGCNKPVCIKNCFVSLHPPIIH